MRKEYLFLVLSVITVLFNCTFITDIKAATITVNSLADDSPSLTGNGQCTLREAIQNANTNNQTSGGDCVAGSGADIININLNGTINLVAALQNLTGTLTINGAGVGTIIMRNADDYFRIFNVPNGATVTITNLTATNGRAPLTVDEGGGIRNAGTLTLNTVVVTANSGGYSNAGGGAGIANVTGNLTVINSSITNNQSVNFFCGAGINNAGILNISNSTISGNVASTCGGGIYNSGNATVTNVTISGNTSQTDSGGFGGGGINNETGASITLTNCTITNNNARGSGGGGGIRAFGGTVTLRNSIVAGNIADTTTSKDISDTIVSQGYNLVGKSDGSFGLNAGLQDQFGTNASPLDPRLSTLANNGGPTQTHALQVSPVLSPALDKGKSFGVTTDQRGMIRPFQYANLTAATGGDRADIGALEINGLIVTKTADTNDNVCDTDCSLREAVSVSNSGGTVGFASPLFDTPQTITLSSTIQINKHLLINGKGGTLLTIDGQNLNRIFSIGSSFSVTITAMRLYRGNAQGQSGGGILNAGSLNLANLIIESCAGLNGGGISNTGALSVNESTLKGNSATSGGGIFTAQGASSYITNSTFSGNNASCCGGALSNNGSSTFINSTIANNTTTGKGGGIYLNAVNDAVVSTTNVTISGNSAGFRSGGVDVESDPAATNVRYNLRNTIISGNTSAQTCPDIFAGIRMYSYGYNLRGTTTCNAFEPTSPSLTGNITGDARLAPLGDYGGTVQTFALLQNSPALNIGDFNNLAAATDQRGTGAPRLIGSTTDIGAFERNIIIDQASLSNGFTSAFYSRQLSATRQSSFADGEKNESSKSIGFAPTTFSIIPISGQQLPSGISLSTSGLISGTPTATGSFTFTIKVTDTDGMAGVSRFTISIGSPTASLVSVGGRVSTHEDKGLRNAVVTLIDMEGNSRSTITTLNGYYQFEGVEVGKTYIFRVFSKRFLFTPQFINVIEETDELNFEAYQYR